MQQEAIRLYTGINEKSWNGREVQPGPYACIAPVYGRSKKTQEINSVSVPQQTAIIQDSGAFSDMKRLSIEEALERQYRHSQKYGYDSQITHRASYDLLIDEKWIDGYRRKERWSELDAEQAIHETISAAIFISKHLDRSNGVAAILSAQGVSPAQYLRCTQEIISQLQPGDILGLGGWCITGKMPAVMLPVFKATMRIVIPYAGRARVGKVHIWGVCFAKALAEILLLCDEYSIELSVDSASPQLRPVFGKWGYAEWRDKSYRRPAPDILGEERARHNGLTRQWLAKFRDTIHYQKLSTPSYEQQALFDEVAV